ncbi:Hypothetical predicted protein [Mytilus galloprovincialis]|uniref:DZIP3-like HEPN domain-containing protein n=1 Tax=Mytilus galloprovincialis TaxID=29158 RepID=A0A8B6GAE8_MYTGA|nr:Hypothetical predicted protein [Mytilus galloprovincialis]
MKNGMKNGYSKIDLRCTNLSSLIMGDVESDEHLRIFKCLIDTGSLVLRNIIGIKLLNNYSISFVQYLENNKHQFYHQFEKRISRKCCLGSPHGCVFNGTMDKHIFYKMYTKRTAQNTRNCLDRFEINASISLDMLDLSDLYFLLWNSRLLSTPDENSLKKIMFIRSEICHPPSSRSYSIVELKRYWSDLESAVLVFAEPKCYKDIVEMQIKTLQNCNLNALESAKIIEKISTESDKIMLAIQQVGFHLLISPYN